MEPSEHERIDPEEVVSEIASILARGCLRYFYVKGQIDDVKADEDPLLLTENRLDCPRDGSNHSEPT